MVPQVSGLRKVVVPKQLADAAQPSNDVLYLDATMRVTRGGDNGKQVSKSERGVCGPR